MSVFSKVWDRIRNEPAFLLSALAAAAQAAVGAPSWSVAFSLAAGVLIRQLVTPV